MVDLRKDRVEFPDLKRAAVELAQRLSLHAVLVKVKASGQRLIQELRNLTRLPVLAIPWLHYADDEMAPIRRRFTATKPSTFKASTDARRHK
ncbi:MAG: hypothetical protein V4508_21355 [Pseudomonadota bacterium]